MDKLKLEHIAAYLPYGLKTEIKHINHFNKIIVSELSPIVIVDWQRGNFELKPILIPLSDLTKEIKHNSLSIQLEPKLESVIPMDLIYKHYFYTIRKDGHYSYHIGDGTVIGSCYRSAPYGLIDLLLQWHFDIHGLIKQGLAIDINTL